VATSASFLRGQNPWAADHRRSPSYLHLTRVRFTSSFGSRRILRTTCWFLNSVRHFVQTLKSIMRGSNIPFISKADLQKLTIPVLDIVGVGADSAYLNRLCARERRIA